MDAAGESTGGDKTGEGGCGGKTNSVETVAGVAAATCEEAEEEGEGTARAAVTRLPGVA